MRRKEEKPAGHGETIQGRDPVFSREKPLPRELQKYTLYILPFFLKDRDTP